MESWVGLTLGTGGEGACITSRIFLGGWLYPDAASTEPDCAATGRDTAQVTITPTIRWFRAFRTDITFPPLQFTGRTGSGANLTLGESGKSMKGGGGASFRGAKAFHHKVHRGFAKVAKEGQNHNLG